MTTTFDPAPTPDSVLSHGPMITAAAHSWLQGPRAVHSITELIPPMPPAQLEALIDQARRTGRIPGSISIWRGHLVDGRSRVRCADKLRMTVTETDISHLQETTLVDYVLEMNVFRRHLTAGQRALVAIDASRRAAKLGLKHITRERAAAAAGVSASSLHALQHALAITPQLIEPVRAGIISINLATEACQVLIDWPPAACDDLVARLMRLDSAEAAKLVRSLGPRSPSTARPALARTSQAERSADADHISAAPLDTAAHRSPIKITPSPALAWGSETELASLLPAFRELARLHKALCQSAGLTPEDPAAEATNDILAAIRAVLDLDWHTLQHHLAALADRLATPVASSPSGTTSEEETRHGS